MDPLKMLLQQALEVDKVRQLCAVPLASLSGRL